MYSSNSLCLGSTGPFPHVIYVNLNTMVLGINFNLLVKQLKQIIVIICISNTHSRKCHLCGFLVNINWSIEYILLHECSIYGILTPLNKHILSLEVHRRYLHPCLHHLRMLIMQTKWIVRSKLTKSQHVE